MSNELAKFNPAALAGIIGKEELATVNNPFSAGIKSADFLPMLSIRGNRFRLKIEGQETVIPDMSLDVFLLSARDGVSKTFYEGGYSTGEEAKAPDCSSADGVHPDSNVEHPVSTTCQLCPNNAWGSKITQTGKKGKACNDYKLIVLALAAAPDKAFALRIPAASLKPFASYISKLNMAGVPANAARTRVSLGDTEFPSLLFDFAGTVETREIYDTLSELANSSDVLNAVRVERQAPAAPVQSAVQPVVVEVAQPAPEPEPATPTLADILGSKPKTTRKKKDPEPTPEPEQVAEVAQVEEDAGAPITSLDQLLGRLKK